MNTSLSTYSSVNGSWTNKVGPFTDNSGDQAFVIGRTTGTTRTINLTGLTAGTTYYVYIQEYNGTSTAEWNTSSPLTQNPRSFTTQATIDAPTWPTSPITVDNNNNTVQITWNSVTGATGYELDIEYYNGSNWQVLNEYNDVDVGNSTTWGVYLPIAVGNDNYRAIVRAYNASATSANSTPQTFTISSSMPPKFLAGDAPSLQTLTGTNSGNFELTVTFDQDVYNSNAGSGDLTNTSFAAYAPNTGSGLNDASSKVVITGVTKISQSVWKLNIRFNARVENTEGFRIGPANATSIYSGIIAPATAGIPMDVSLHATKGGQYSADITCPTATVLNTNDNIAFTTIQGAIDAGTTTAGETIQLKENTTYSENVTVNKAVTITDQNTNNAIVTGTWTLGGTSDVNLGGGTLAISGLTFNPSLQAIIVGNVYNGTVSIQDNTFTLDNANDIAISVQSNRGTGNLAALNIGTATANTFSGTAGKAIYFNDDGSGGNGITAVSVQQNTFPTSGVMAIDFENVNLTSYLPPIDLGYNAGPPAVNNTNSDNMLIPAKYVYSHANLNDSRYLYPGIAVLGTTTTLENGTATE